MARQTLTVARVESLRCPVDKDQVFLWDDKVAGLAVRLTKVGVPVFIFQGRYSQRTLRLTIGKFGIWSINDARERARQFQRQLDEGLDPRAIIKGQKARDKAERARVETMSKPLHDFWLIYLQSQKTRWSDNYYLDHVKASSPGGIQRKRANGVKTVPGVLDGLLKLRLRDLTRENVVTLAIKEQRRPTKLSQGLRMFRTFLKWIAEEYPIEIDTSVASSKRLQLLCGKSHYKVDHLLKEQLGVWFGAVNKISNPIISAYLQCLLLTGARRYELLTLRWEDVDLHWRQLTIKDKIENSRTVPLTKHCGHLISNLPRVNEFVFSSCSSSSGHLVEPSIAYRKAMSSVGLYVTLHGLRRSFKSLSEWLDLPVGVVAQIMGHKPSATAEKHYTQRPVDLLRIHHQRLEDWILNNAESNRAPVQNVALLRGANA